MLDGGGRTENLPQGPSFVYVSIICHRVQVRLLWPLRRDYDINGNKLESLMKLFTGMRFRS